MGRIEERKPESATAIIEHMKGEIYRNFRRLLGRNEELEAEISQRPGSEMYSLDLERIRKEIRAVEEKINNED